MTSPALPSSLPVPPRPKVYIATPSHDHKFHASFAFSLFRLQAARLFPIKISRVGGAGVARARNNQAHEFLTGTDCEYFCCIDGDIDFQPEHFARLIVTGLENINGLYPLKQEELQWCVNALPGELPDPLTGLQRVASAGTGFKFIKRSVFERHIAAHPEIAYVEDLGGARGLIRHDFFSMGVIGPNSAQSRLDEISRLCAEPGGDSYLCGRIREIVAKKHPPGRYLTEDWYFDYRCGGLGIPVHVDTTFHVKHEGLISFPLQDVFASEKYSQIADAPVIEATLAERDAEIQRLRSELVEARAQLDWSEHAARGSASAVQALNSQPSTLNPH